MITSDEILSRLAQGESAEAIAAEFTSQLNSAMKTHEERKNSTKAEDTKQLIAAVVQYAQKYYPELELEETDLDPAELSKDLDRLVKAFTRTGNALRGVWGY